MIESITRGGTTAVFKQLIEVSPGQWVDPTRIVWFDAERGRLHLEGLDGYVQTWSDDVIEKINDAWSVSPFGDV